MKKHFEVFLKAISLLLVSLIFLTTAVSCNKEVEKEYYDSYFIAMDTQVTLRLARDSGQRDGKKVIYFEDSYLESVAKECADIAANVEGIFSRTDENSVTYEVNGSADSYFELNSEFCSLLNRSFEISDKTNGAFDVTLGTVTELWNVTAEDPVVPSEEAISEALSHCGRDKITLEESNIIKTDRLTKLDFGAIAKGYALSLISEHLKDTDILYGLVSFGGNVSVFGTKGEDTSFKVGITDPSDTSKVVGYVYVNSGYVSVSGDYERFFESDSVKYHHIMDGTTGRPAETDISSVSVICSDGTLADALSTALFVMGHEGALDFYNSNIYDFEAVITLKDGTTVTTNGLNAEGLFEEYAEDTESAQ